MRHDDIITSARSVNTALLVGSVRVVYTARAAMVVLFLALASERIRTNGACETFFGMLPSVVGLDWHVPCGRVTVALWVILDLNDIVESHLSLVVRSGIKSLHS